MSGPFQHPADSERMRDMLAKHLARFAALGAATPFEGRVACFCCGYPTVPFSEPETTCTLCRWDQDIIDDISRPEIASFGANMGYSLLQARANFRKHLSMYDVRDDRCRRARYPGTEEKKHALMHAYATALLAEPEDLLVAWETAQELEWDLELQWHVPATTILLDRVISPEEAAVLTATLERAAHVPISPEILSSISTLHVVRGCGCGCPTIDFECEGADASQTMMYAGGGGVTRGGHGVGINVFGTPHGIGSLEIYRGDGKADGMLPDPATIRGDAGSLPTTIQ